MYMNEAISAKELLSYQTLVFNSAATLIAAEIPYLYRADDSDQKPMKPGPSDSFKPVEPEDVESIMQGNGGNGDGTP